MAISDIAVQHPATTAPRSKRSTLARATAILTSQYQGELSSEEIIRRVSAVRDLLRDIEAPRTQRRALDRALMNMAIREPNANDEARAIIGQIFRELAPKYRASHPQRDARGKLIPITDPGFPLNTLADDEPANLPSEQA